MSLIKRTEKRPGDPLEFPNEDITSWKTEGSDINGENIRLGGLDRQNFRYQSVVSQSISKLGNKATTVDPKWPLQYSVNGATMVISNSKIGPFYYQPGDTFVLYCSMEYRFTGYRKDATSMLDRVSLHFVPVINMPNDTTKRECTAKRTVEIVNEHLQCGVHSGFRDQMVGSTGVVCVVPHEYLSDFGEEDEINFFIEASYSGYATAHVIIDSCSFYARVFRR